jgi:glycosyltransferase involved in cell wall biosynthesis
VLLAGFLPGTGYGNATRDYLTLLDNHHVAVQWVPLQIGGGSWGRGYFAAPPDGPLPPAIPNAKLATHKIDPAVSLLHTTREFWRKLSTEYPADRTLAYTTFEQTMLPEVTVRMLNELDGVLVPSRFNFEIFRTSGVTVPIYVVPHVIEPAVFELTEEIAAPLPDKITEKTFVVSVVGPWQARKAIGSSIEAFLRAFGPSDDVILVIKTSAQDYIKRQPTAVSIGQILGRHGRAPPIHLITTDLSTQQLAAIVRRSDCSLSLTRGEGFGLTIAEAVSLGTPTVTTGWGAPPEFLGSDYPLFVDHTMIDVASEPADDWADTTGEWAKADIDHAASLLSWVRNHRKAARSAVKTAQRQLAQRCGPQIVAASLLNALEINGTNMLDR